MILTINSRLLNKRELTQLRSVRMPRTITTYRRRYNRVRILVK